MEVGEQVKGIVMLYPELGNEPAVEELTVGEEEYEHHVFLSQGEPQDDDSRLENEPSLGGEPILDDVELTDDIQTSLDSANRSKSQGHYEAAMQHCEEAISELMIPNLDSDGKWLGNAYNLQGSIYREQGKYTLALQAFQKALNTLPKTGKSGSTHPDVGRCYYNMAKVM